MADKMPGEGTGGLGDRGIALVRTLSPMLAGFVLAVAARAGLAVTSPIVLTAIPTMLAMAWYSAAWWLEARHPKIARSLRLLVIAVQPTYRASVPAEATPNESGQPG